ncbi:MAG: hypothetical protein ACOYN5_01505 [Bacteroidales bacterium]
MSESSKPQYAAVEYPLQNDFPIVHCPICGQGTHHLNEDGSSEMTPCPHLSFIFIGEPPTFDYTSEEFSQRIKGKKLDNLSYENFKKFLTSLGYDNKMLALEITHGGLADNGGPIWFTDMFGFDYSVIE